jgi:transcriptional regulator GlxA family with amidase domain
LDTLVIAGGDGVNAAAADTILVDWVRERIKQARRTASVCTGAFLLPRRACLMADELPALGVLRRTRPTVSRHPCRARSHFVQDRGIWTSAGVTAGIDLALARLRKISADQWRW